MFWWRLPEINCCSSHMSGWYILRRLTADNFDHLVKLVYRVLHSSYCFPFPQSILPPPTIYSLEANYSSKMESHYLERSIYTIIWSSPERKRSFPHLLTQLFMSLWGGGRQRDKEDLFVTIVNLLTEIVLVLAIRSLSWLLYISHSTTHWLFHLFASWYYLLG